MQTPVLIQYGHVLLFLLAGMGFAFFSLFILSPLLRYKSNDARQRIPYECGMEPVGSAFVPVDIGFSLFALLFVVFDVEALFIFPWAVVFKDLGWPAFWEMALFMAVLFLGLLYAWRRGALRWR
jgi:NADH:ubiquinone oxidoreductase subunit 3 (subunit A)